MAAAAVSHRSDPKRAWWEVAQLHRNTGGESRAARQLRALGMCAHANLANQLCSTCSAILLVTLRENRDADSDHVSVESIEALGRIT